MIECDIKPFKEAKEMNLHSNGYLNFLQSLKAYSLVSVRAMVRNHELPLDWDVIEFS